MTISIIFASFLYRLFVMNVFLESIELKDHLIDDSYLSYFFLNRPDVFLMIFIIKQGVFLVILVYSLKDIGLLSRMQMDMSL